MPFKAHTLFGKLPKLFFFFSFGCYSAGLILCRHVSANLRKIDVANIIFCRHCKRFANLFLLLLLFRALICGVAAKKRRWKSSERRFIFQVDSNASWKMILFSQGRFLFSFRLVVVWLCCANEREISFLSFCFAICNADEWLMQSTENGHFFP